MKSDRMNLRSPATKMANKTELGLAAAIVLALVVISFLVFTGEEEDTTRHYAVIALDVSASTSRASLCDDMARILEDELARSGERQITILGTGGRDTANEPVRLGSFKLERSVRVLEGKTSGEEKQIHILGEARRLCEKLPLRQESPIFNTVATATKYFSGIRCGEGGATCSLMIRTDGVEEIDETVKRALTKPLTRSPRIENTGVSIGFCGLADRRTNFRAKLPSLAAVETAFKPEFSDQNRVTFDAACGAFAVAREGAHE